MTNSRGDKNKTNSITPSTIYTTATSNAITVKCKIQLIKGNRKTLIAN